MIEKTADERTTTRSDSTNVNNGRMTIRWRNRVAISRVSE